MNVAIDCDREIERIHSLFLMNLEKLDELQSKSLVKTFRIQPVHIQISYRIELRFRVQFHCRVKFTRVNDI